MVNTKPKVVIDHVYLAEAEGYHGILSPFLKRCKIGVSGNVDKRMASLNKSQPPCNILELHSIYHPDAYKIEKYLHNKYNYCRVNLLNSEEWFDLNPIDYLRVHRDLYIKEGKEWNYRKDKGKGPLIKTLIVLVTSLIPIAIISNKVIEDCTYNKEPIPIINNK
ncbi:GIY-YIG nuclease family protein [Calothrix sp. FACHB-1219]|uniref:GIY-YIG nuclease family protein n=1 Tax=unclassified Calothrix TaxID=2619626 RepID=UPI001689D5B6|nr:MULTISPECIES: GIY-YIG nuclease family protein [unclassified Calothrix]MBD2201662.1 GIY-YIG nuclease family protein [Calothrix sp. FACHB-168]MBD2217348.1 GIY-YIG nuclease family protein [Calothrix sp. FACHB-1219]